jgi:hypothetical protein
MGEILYERAAGFGDEHFVFDLARHTGGRWTR